MMAIVHADDVSQKMDAVIAMLNDTIASCCNAGSFEMTYRKLSGLNYRETPEQRELRIKLAVIQYDLKRLR